MKKRLASFVLCTILILNIFSIYSYASTENLGTIDGTIEDDNDEINRRYVGCPVGPGKHDMMPKGWGSLYKGPQGNCELVFSFGACSQCKYCHLVVVSQYDPAGGKLGTYAMQSYSEEISWTYTNLYKNASDILYNSSLANDPVFEGFYFHDHY